MKFFQRHIIDCEFLAKPRKSMVGVCSLGLYGGRPTVTECQRCLSAGENNPDTKAAADQLANRTHPLTANRISGCCDRADQA